MAKTDQVESLFIFSFGSCEKVLLEMFQKYVYLVYFSSIASLFCFPLPEYELKFYRFPCNVAYLVVACWGRERVGLPRPSSSPDQRTEEEKQRRRQQQTKDNSNNEFLALAVTKLAETQRTAMCPLPCAFV